MLAIGVNWLGCQAEYLLPSCMEINPLNTRLNCIFHLLALLGVHYILHISRIRVKNEWSTDITFLFLLCDRMESEVSLLLVCLAIFQHVINGAVPLSSG
jgi:hypothetical protein